jgi:dsDNA-specific endonuclease/ATPase MutS2
MAANPEFHVGDLIEVLDDTTRGVIYAIAGDRITVESTEGFRFTFHPSEIVRITGQQRLLVSNEEAARAKLQEQKEAGLRSRRTKKRERETGKMEVDLHIHQLVPSTRGMTTFDILNLQLETAKRQLDFAIQKRIPKVVFIHGVGEGVLREELKYLFGRYDNLRFYDADYQKYGLGATEVYIFQNP